MRVKRDSRSENCEDCKLLYVKRYYYGERAQKHSLSLKMINVQAQRGISLRFESEKALPNGNGDVRSGVLEQCALSGLNKSVPYALSASLI